MPQNESKHDRFKRIATKRVRNAIKMIERIGNLATPGYQYTEEEAEKIFSTIQETVDNVKVLFSAKKKESKKFEL